MENKPERRRNGDTKQALRGGIIIEIKIREYSASDRIAFIEMLVTCFSQDYKLSATQAQLEGWCDTLEQQAAAQIVFLDILTIDDAPQGFILYQIDSPESDWCVKEGYGFIRELYVAKDFRNAGYGKVLVSHAENKLRQRCVPGLYLTTDMDEAAIFWTKMGYQDSGEICPENNAAIFLK